MGKKRKKSRQNGPRSQRSEEESQGPATPETDPAKQDSPIQEDLQPEAGAPDRPLVSMTNRFSRYFSFALLIGVIIFVGFLFYEVMAQFLVPLFLSAILVVVFRPLHQWSLERCQGRLRTSALLTTIAVLLIVLVPLGIVLMLAAAESRQVVRQFNTANIADGIRQARATVGLNLPPEIARIDRELDLMLSGTSLTGETEDIHRIALYEAETAAKSLAAEQDLEWPETPGPSSDVENEKAPALFPNTSPWQTFAERLIRLRAMHDQMKWTSAGTEVDNQQRISRLHDYQQLLNETATAFLQFKTGFLGGKSRTWLTELANPSQEKYDQYVESATSFLRDQLLTLSGKGLAVVGKLLLGAAIMMIGFYFFLVDGPSMLETFKGLSPIDDEHEEELVAEFEQVTRAVVVATLLSAAVQGLLAGIGFYFAGLESVFLLMVLSGVLAMVPFVGAASVWMPCSMYLYFVEDRMFAAVALAIYGTAVISMADNVIKPMVLHGQSKLHPLLAFLSVIGGVSALGPIGILIGPMVVAFLQTLLRILRREVTDLGEMSEAAAAQRNAIS